MILIFCMDLFKKFLNILICMSNDFDFLYGFIYKVLEYFNMYNYKI